MRWLWLILLFSNLATASELWLRVGEVLNLPAARAAKVRIGSRGIVRAIDGDRVIRLVGLKVGQTSLIVDETAYVVRVSSAGQRDFVAALRRDLSLRLGLKLSLEDEARPVIYGTLLRFSDWQELGELARRQHGEYSFRAQALPEVADEAMDFLNHLAREHGFPILSFRASPEFTALLPRAAVDLRSAAEEALRPFGIHVEMSDSRLAIEPLIRTQVILAEVERSFSRTFGVQWPSEYQAQLLPKLGPAEGPTLATLKALEQSGQAQVLASPTLLCRSGSEATFHAGGEFPIRMMNRHFQEVVWKSHGVILRVKPRADFHGAISLEVESEVSLLDMAHAVDGVPALKVSSVRSHFDLPGKRTIALSGLLRQELGSSSEGLPLLSQIPILGPLFSSRSFQKHQSELVVFVTPEVTTPEPDQRVAMPEGWVQFER